jgi:hypothetical protein
MSKVKDKSLVDFSEIQLREIFTKAGLNSQDIDKAVADYIRYRESEISSLSILSHKELQNLGEEAFYKIIKELRSGENILKDILIHYLSYIKYKKKIAETYQESKSWDKVITTVVYLDSKDSQEAFIDYVEETYQTKVKDGKHLQKLTGITEDTLDGLEETVINSRESKYFRALEKALQEGAKYKDLLQIKPQDYGLPESWGSRYGEPNTAYTSILRALSFEFLINEPALLTLLPDLRSIAEEVEAPYSVLMDCYNLTNKGKKYGATGD